MYVDSYVLINGQKLILSSGNFDYYLRYGSAPAVCLFDINGDSILDIMISDHCDRAGMVQNIYMSEDNGLYTELGTVVWNENNSCKPFSFQVLLLDNYEVLVETEDFGISETVRINYDFRQVASDLGLYDDNGKFIIRVISLIDAGYSSYDLGCGFIFEWTIEDNQYQLLNVDFFSNT